MNFLWQAHPARSAAGFVTNKSIADNRLLEVLREPALTAVSPARRNPRSCLRANRIVLPTENGSTEAWSQNSYRL